MTSTKRYTLIVVGIIIFAVLAPAFILGVRGYIYDFETNRLVQTGILVAKTQPKDAKITIEGLKNKTKKTNTTIRFLPTGGYKVRIEKTGFHPWEKHLFIRGGLVTWLSKNAEKLYLIPENLKPEKVLNSYQNEKEELGQYVYQLEESVETPGRYDIVLINKSNLLDRTLIKKGATGHKDAEVYAAPNGLIFLLADRVLYQVGSNLEYIADGVDTVSWNAQLNQLVYGNAHEITFYNPFESEPNQRELLTRTSEPGGSFCIMKDIGWALRVYGNMVRAIELDGRDRRNIYDLLQVKDNSSEKSTQPEIVECDESGEKIVIKEGATYKIYSLK